MLTCSSCQHAAVKLYRLGPDRLCWSCRSRLNGATSSPEITAAESEGELRARKRRVYEDLVACVTRLQGLGYVEEAKAVVWAADRVRGQAHG